MVCLPSLLSRRPAMSPDVRIAVPLRRYQIPTSVSLNGTNIQQGFFWNSWNVGTSPHIVASVWYQDDSVSCSCFAKTIDSRPVRSRCACTEVMLCVVQLNCVCLWTSWKKKKKHKEGTMFMYRGNVVVYIHVNTVKTESTYSFLDTCLWKPIRVREFSPSRLLKCFPQFWYLSNSNEQRRQFLVHLDHHDVPISWPILRFRLKASLLGKTRRQECHSTSLLQQLLSNSTLDRSKFWTASHWVSSMRDCSNSAEQSSLSFAIDRFQK